MGSVALELERSSPKPVVGGLILTRSICQSVPGQETEPHFAPGGQALQLVWQLLSPVFRGENEKLL